ncbi:MAG: hypothetical protein M5U34_36610 [Chloroflexi bacterium]|nr:hypothetical protein [Chloroflexota bacterium]
MKVAEWQSYRLPDYPTTKLSDYQTTPLPDYMTTFPIDTHFDENFADEIARLESYNKHIYRPNTYLHKWWARRCGSTFRTILKHLVLDETRQDYYAAGD